MAVFYTRLHTALLRHGDEICFKILGEKSKKDENLSTSSEKGP